METILQALEANYAKKAAINSENEVLKNQLRQKIVGKKIVFETGKEGIIQTVDFTEPHLSIFVETENSFRFLNIQQLRQMVVKDE